MGDCGENMFCSPDEHKCYPQQITGCDNNNTNCPSEICDEPNWPYTTCTYCDGQNCKYGDQQVVNKVHCETNILNTPADNEFANGAETVFDKKVTVGVFEDNAGCLNAPLGGVLTDSTYTWTGTG